MKNKKRAKGRSGLSRLVEKMDDRNPFLKPLLLWLFGFAAAVCVLALLRRFGSWGSLVSGAAFVVIAGPTGTGLTASILNCIGFWDYKKDHPGEKIDKETYIRRKEKAKKDFESRYNSMGEFHRRH